MLPLQKRVSYCLKDANYNKSWDAAVLHKWLSPRYFQLPGLFLSFVDVPWRLASVPPDRHFPHSWIPPCPWMCATSCEVYNKNLITSDRLRLALLCLKLKNKFSNLYSLSQRPAFRPRTIFREARSIKKMAAFLQTTMLEWWGKDLIPVGGEEVRYSFLARQRQNKRHLL